MDSDNTPTCVMVWAESVQDEDGDEVRDWYVALGNDDGEPVDEGNISWFYSDYLASSCNVEQYMADTISWAALERRVAWVICS